MSSDNNTKQTQTPPKVKKTADMVAYRKAYYAKHKNKLIKNLLEKVKCSACQCDVSKVGYANHLKTNKHKKNVELNEYKKDDFPIIDITKHPNKKELERIEEIYKELKAVLSKLRTEGDDMIEEAKDLERMKKLKKQLSH